MNYLISCFFCMLFASGLPDIVVAQSSQIEKANELYKTGQYAKAIAFYEEALAIRDNNAVRSKLAYSYRMINRQDKSEPLYAAVIKSGKARPDDYYYYGESLMSAGKYSEAKQNFQKFLELEPDDERAPLMISNCERAHLIQDLFQNVSTQPFSQNSEADDNAPVLWQHGILFASDRNLGFRLLKEKSDWTGRDYINLYYAPAAGENVFSEADLYSSKINDLNKNTGNASFTADGAMIFFSRNSDELSKNNSYNLQLFAAESAGSGKWKNPKPLPFCSPEWNYMHPAVAPDGKTLFFVTDKKDGQGGTDLYMSSLTKKGWSNAVNLGPVINTPANEGFPFFSSDGQLYFCSKGHPGFGGFDIFRTARLPNEAWEKPVNIGRPFNSTYDDISIFINPENNAGLFTSSRDGGDDDIYLFKIGDGTGRPGVVIETAVPENPVPAKIKVPEPDPVSLPNQVVEPVKKTPAPNPDSPVPVKSKGKTDNRAVKPDETVGNAPLPVVKSAPQTRLPEEKSILKQPVLDIAPQVTSPPPAKNYNLNDLEWFLRYKQPVMGKIFIIEGIYYPQDQIAVTPSIALQLDKVADLLLQYPFLKVEMGVHTESVGDDAKNLLNSRYRSEIVVEYLVFKGVDPKRLSYKGYGETQPLNGCINGVNCLPEEYRINNRLEMKIM